MTVSLKTAARALSALLSQGRPDELAERLSPADAPPPPRVRHHPELSEERVAARWARLDAPEGVEPALKTAATQADMAAYARNIENFIGEARLPIGLAGPLRVNGVAKRADYYAPLATTEAALVASYARGAELITASGGCAAVVLSKGVARAPGFRFRTVGEAGLFAHWVAEHLEDITQAAEATTRHGEVADVGVNIEGNHVYLVFTFETGDASGQNMVTIATDAACKHIIDACPIAPVRWFVEANLSGDKKATTQSFQSVRGRKAVAEIRIPRELVAKRLHTTPEAMLDYWRMSALGGVMSGQIGVQGHVANGLAALYIATGQDVATVAEGAVGVTRLEVDAEADALYASVTMPNLIVGTVGGGTNLPTQAACLELLGLKGEGCSDAFAELCAALSLAGELSIIGALSAGHFARAHASLARGSKAT